MIIGRYVGELQGRRNADTERDNNNDPYGNSSLLKTSHLYCVLSAMVAFLAIVTSSRGHNQNEIAHTQKLSKKPVDTSHELSIENLARAAATAIVPDITALDNKVLNEFENIGKNNEKNNKVNKSQHQKNNKSNDMKRVNNENESSPQPFWFRLLSYVGLKEVPLDIGVDGSFSSTSDRHNDNVILRWIGGPRNNEQQQRKHPGRHRTPMSFFYSMVDRAILEPGGITRVVDKVLTSTPRLLAIANLLLAVTYLLHSAVADFFLGDPTGTYDNDLTSTRAGRDRLGGFLVFKLLLISSVVDPDTLDLLILLGWYTLLSFLRSLSHLAGSTTQHSSQSGLPPRSGVLRLLLLVFCINMSAAAGCVALFHGAGVGMVLLLTCDCALLALDVIVHLCKHAVQVLEEAQLTSEGGEGDNNENSNDRRIDPNTHAQRLAALDTTILIVELLVDLLTSCHFLHIWSLHGLTMGLVDGVLALHLHTAVSRASKKIAERRNLYKISRELDGMFEDATEQDIQKALMSKDMCCICLGSMNSSGNVKKVGCGHLFHTQCLREVVERARSIEAVRCPLCRSSVVNGTQSTRNNNSTVIQGVQAQPDVPVIDNAGPPAIPVLHEHALFRFSTEGILPAWLPLPAFSFEVVRRPPVPQLDVPPDNVIAPAGQVPPTAQNNQPQQQQQQPQEDRAPSFWRRLLLLTGALPMSQEEEAAALTQLVDMFPQYDRALLQRELRERASLEAVVESILLARDLQQQAPNLLGMDPGVAAFAGAH